MDDSFLRIGGDSIGAMRLVAAARERGLLLTVADVFKHSRLCDLAGVVSQGAGPGEETVEPFLLLKVGLDEPSVRKETVLLCGLEPRQIEDVFLCTPLQAGLLALTAKRAGDYVSRNVLELCITVDVDRFRTVWGEMAAATPILRTRIVDLTGQGLVQVVLDERLQWSSDNDLIAYLAADDRLPRNLGTPLTQFGLVEEPGSERKRFFVWTIHHALYDGWSMGLLMENVEKVYRGETLQPSSPFQAFVKHIMDSDDDRAVSLLQEQLAGAEAQPFPALLLATYQPRADKVVMYHVGGLQWPESDVTASTAVRTVWSILAV